MAHGGIDEREEGGEQYADGALSVWHGPRKLARYGPGGELLADKLPAAA